MPKLSGKEVAHRLRLSNPKLKVLYMSGYADDVISPGEILSSGLQPESENRSARSNWPRR